MAHFGMDMLTAIKEGRPAFPPPEWVVHMRLHEEMAIERIEPGRIVSNWTPGRHFSVPDGYVQGGLIGAVADGNQTLTLFSTLSEMEFWVTMDLHTRFVRPIRCGESVRVDTRVINKGASQAVLETQFALPGDKLAAIVAGGWRKVDGDRRASP